MATAHSRHGASSTAPFAAAPPSSPSPSSAFLRRRSSIRLSADKPPEFTAVDTSDPADVDHHSNINHNNHNNHNGNITPPPPHPPRSPPPRPSILQPRVAVVLNVPKPWHPWLFALRLCSILPALWWGLPSLLRLLLYFLPGPPDQFLLVRPGGSCAGLSSEVASSSPSCAVDHDGKATAVVVAPYALTETALATIWCFACGYLSFFFTDCLMSRWLIHYTPQATLVRLLSINAVNAYLTLSVLSITGGFQDPRLLLPGWVGIATTLTVCYHITHQKINIRKETSTSVNVFSIASYVTMVVLLAHMQSYQPDYPAMPLVTKGRRLWQEGQRFFFHVRGLVNEYAESSRNNPS